jgi:hypothetical protein
MLSCVRLVPIRTRTLVKVMNTSLTHSVLSTPTSSRAFSVLSRPPPSYDGHIPLTRIERGALALGPAPGAVANPRRAGTSLQASLSYTIADCSLMKPGAGHFGTGLGSRQRLCLWKSCEDFQRILLKAFEFANIRLPMAALGMFAVVRLKSEERNRFSIRIYRGRSEIVRNPSQS